MLDLYELTNGPPTRRTTTAVYTGKTGLTRCLEVSMLLAMGWITQAAVPVLADERVMLTICVVDDNRSPLEGVTIELRSRGYTPRVVEEATAGSGCLGVDVPRVLMDVHTRKAGMMDTSLSKVDMAVHDGPLELPMSPTWPIVSTCRTYMSCWQLKRRERKAKRRWKRLYSDGQ